MPTIDASQTSQGTFAETSAAADALAQRTQHEASIKRNPHPDFKLVEGSRPDWEEKTTWHFTKTRAPDWHWGQGGNDGGASLDKQHIQIDPHAPGRPPTHNYKLLISGIVPRPIGFLSTLAGDGKWECDARKIRVLVSQWSRVLAD